jgi:hypothetical protein
MAPTLGKRKRRTAEATEDNREDDGEGSASLELDAQEIFRRHFEAQFKPLPVVQKTVKEPEEAPPEDESEEDSEWDGISEEEETTVQVVEHVDAHSQIAAMSKEELKVFMVLLLSACNTGFH